MKKSMLLGAILFSGFVLSACGGSSDTETKEANENTTVTSVAKEAAVSESTSVGTQNETSGDFVPTAADAYFDGTMLKGNSYSVRITDHKVIQPGEPGNEYSDKPVMAFWFDTLVNPDYDNSTPITPNTAWVMNFEAVQDNDPNKVNVLNVGTLPDDQFLNDQTAEIKPGGTVASAFAYELTDTETPVTLTAKSMLGDDFGSAEFPVK